MVFHDWYEPYYKAEYGNDAVGTFFGLVVRDTHRLFYKNSYSSPTKRNVIRRIKAFVKANT